MERVANADHLSRLDRRAATRAGLRTIYEQMRSPHSLPLQRALGGMALSAASIFRTAIPIRASSIGELLERGMDFVTITDHDTIEGCLADCAICRHVHQRASHDLFPAGSVQDSPPGLGNLRGAARRDRDLCATIFSSCKRICQAQAIAHAVAHPLYSINGKLEASHLERLILLFKHFEGINGLRDALLSDARAKLLFGSLTPQKIDELANRHNLAADPSRAVAENFRRRLGRSRRPIRRVGFHRNAAGEFGGRISSRHVRDGDCEAHGEGGTPLALVPRLLQHGLLFHSGSVSRKTRTERGRCWRQMFSRFMEGRDPTEFTLAEKATFIAQGVMSGKIFELAKPANMSLWKELSGLFRAAGSEGEAGRGTERRDRAGAAHVPDGEHGRRTARVSLLRKIRPANHQRKHDRKHAGVERDRADPGHARALHLRVSQPGAVAHMAAREFFAR